MTPTQSCVWTSPDSVPQKTDLIIKKIIKKSEIGFPTGSISLQSRPQGVLSRGHSGIVPAL